MGQVGLPLAVTQVCGQVRGRRGGRKGEGAQGGEEGGGGGAGGARLLDEASLDVCQHAS